MVSKEFHKGRRAAYSALLANDTAELFFAGDEKQENGDQNYPFVPDADFYYLTGFDKPRAVLGVAKKDQITTYTLFVEHTDKHMARWLGLSYTPAGVKKSTGIRNIRYVDEIKSWTNTCKAQGVHVKKKHGKLDVLRQVKTGEEIALHRRACRVTAQGVDHILQHLKSGLYEYQIEAYFDFVLKSYGVGHAFGTIAASGANACIMHYMKNNSKMRSGDLILFDLGASAGGYASDVSRTYPVNGRFTNRQRQLYEIVLMGLKAAESAAKPGVPKNELQEISKRVMAQELIRIGMIKRPSEIKKYYFHGSGHYIGLFTHDVGDNTAPLQENMMFTLEPGLYFEKEGIGIRIEDTLLVKKNGIEILTDSIPKEIDEIEAVMKQNRHRV